MKQYADMSNPHKVKGAEALLLSLLAEGTDMLFGYPGGAIIPVYDHLYGYTDRLHHILTRHEQGAVHAAQGYARATGRVGVCMATSGPGATNLVTGIADAMIDSTPLVCITAQVAAAALGSDAFQEADIISMTMPVTKWNFQITRAEEIPGAIAKAFYIARSGRPGPVVIDFTKNAQNEDMVFSYTPCDYLRSYQPTPPLQAADITQAVEMVNAAEKPLLLVGQGVKLSGGERAVIALAEKGGIPMAETLMGISAVPNAHPLFVGNLGMHGNLAANEMTQQSDLIVAVGMRLSDRVTGDVKSYAPHARIIHIDIDPAELNKNIPVALAVHADAKEALEAMLPGIRYKERTQWLALATAKRREEDDTVVRHDMHPRGDGITMCHRRGAKPNVRGTLLAFQLHAQLHHLGWPRHDGVRAARSHRSKARHARAGGGGHPRRRRLPDDDTGVGDDQTGTIGPENRRAEQLLSGYGPPVAATFP